MTITGYFNAAIRPRGRAAAHPGNRARVTGSSNLSVERNSF